MSNKTERELTTRELISVMIGKTMNYAEINKAIETQFPGCFLGGHTLYGRVRSLVLSPHVKITREARTRATFTLHSVNEAFFARSDSQAKRQKEERGNKKPVKSEKYRTPFHACESRWCHLANWFDQLIRDAQERLASNNEIKQAA